MSNSIHYQRVAYIAKWSTNSCIAATTEMPNKNGNCVSQAFAAWDEATCAKMSTVRWRALQIHGV